jgi:hypothetical protein
MSAGPGTQSASAAPWNSCSTQVFFNPTLGDEGLKLAHASHWPTDSWVHHPPSEIGFNERPWKSEGGVFRGCHNEVKYDVVCTTGLCTGICFDDVCKERTLGTVDISETMPWSGSQSSHCSVRGETAPAGARNGLGGLIGNIVFLGWSCHRSLDHVHSASLGGRDLYVVWHLHLGELCENFIHPTRIELCI